ncbi:Cytochrome P450 monooxygenase sdnE [Colletotrichum fructicola]|nr:Cytochrome P450 monooxygenase sdnE [Colletotrichum fructicola]KAF4938202.1 Cytochrome P450 monooxygenase sdnE [Colletotrichum fructicola]
MDWSVILLLFGAGPLLVFVISAIRRVFFSPLSKFPGPKFAALTLWNEFYWDVVKRGTFIWRIEDMHKKYGPIVRINPYELHIIDPEFYDELYSSNRKSDKYRWWTNLAGADGSSFSTVPHDLHRLRRGALNPFFSVRSVTQLEPLIRSKVEKLSARFGEIAQTGEVVRLDAAFMALTMDIICDYAFANDRKYLDEPDFKLIWKETIIGAFEGGANSVIREGLRLSYGVTTRLPRIAHQDIQYGEHVIPAGTPVSETPYFVLMHPTIFPEPQTFKPERWLEAERRGKRLDKYLVSFGKGSRQCLGMNLAYAELYLATATVIRRFDWEMFETTLDDVVCKHDFFVAVGNLDTKGVRATLSHRQTHKEA